MYITYCKYWFFRTYTDKITTSKPKPKPTTLPTTKYVDLVATTSLASLQNKSRGNKIYNDLIIDSTDMVIL